MTIVAFGTPPLPSTQDETPLECSESQEPVLPADDDLADRWGIGQPESPREARQLSTGVILDPPGFVSHRR